MYRRGNNMKGMPTARKVGYSAAEVQKASQILNRTVETGSLNWLKAKFEHYPLEAVPNLWEGEEGLMKHVPKFPMPPCLVLPPDQLGTEAAADHKSDTEPEEPLFQDDLETGIESTDAYKEAKLKLKKRGMERQFWIKMAKIVMSIEFLNQSTMALRNKLTQVNVKIKKHECQQLVNMYTEMQQIKEKLDKADRDYKKNEFTDLFQNMPPTKKTWFKQQHDILGKLPNNMGCIERKFNFVRTKLREIIHTHFDKLEEFRDVTSLPIILKDAFIKFDKDSLALKVLTQTGENKSEEASCLDANKVDENADEGMDEEGQPKKIRLEHVEDTEESVAVMSKEDIFWERLICMKKMIHKDATTLGRIDKAPLPDHSNVFKRDGSLMCRQLISVRLSIISFNSTLAKLKEEMQRENYEDKKVFTAEMLADEGIEGLTPDNSLLVAEALLNKLKDDYLRIQDEKHFVLESFGFTKDMDLVRDSGDDSLPLVRICAHSRTEVDLKVIVRLMHGPYKNVKKKVPTEVSGQKSSQAAASLGASADGQENSVVGETTSTDVTPKGDLSSGDPTGKTNGVKTSENVAVDKSTGGGNSIPLDEDVEDNDASDEHSPEDSANVSKNVNSLSFFMSTLGPDALTVSGQSSGSASEDFVEKEKQYWDRLQKLLRRIDKLMKQLNSRAKNKHLYKKQMRSRLQSLQQSVKKLSENYELEKVEAYKAGYCTHVVYENLEFHSETAPDILVTSLDQIKQRMNAMFRCFREATERMGMPWMSKI